MKCIKVLPENISDILVKIETISSNLDSKLGFKVMLICEEVITNQVRHTDFLDKIPNIEFCYELVNDSIILEFRDNAKKFDPLKKESPDITSSLEDTTPGGLGIFLVKKYAKELIYKYKDGFNILKVVL